MTKEFTLHAWPTPNAYKVSIMLEECGLEYDIVPVNIGAGDQHTEEFKRLNPNSKMPVLVDQNGPDGEPITIFESGVILQYLAEKTGKFLPMDPAKRYEVLQWLMWQMAGFGPMLGQAHHFRLYAPEKIEYGIERYTNEAKRLYNVLEARLADSEYVGGQEYSIADMAIYPWATLAEKQGVETSDKPHLQKWLKLLSERPAVEKGMGIMSEYKRDPSKSFSDEERQQLFGTR